MSLLVGMRKFPKYRENLRQFGNDIYSYSTKVAEIHDNELWELGHWSATTSSHVNYVADILGLKKVKKY